MNILDAMADPALFGPLFPGETWAAWRAFLAALLGLPMEGDAAALYRHHTGRTTPPAQQFREAALVIGRRGGKSRVLALIAVYLATFRDYSAHVVPGEQPVIAIIAADRKQARVLLRYVTGTLKAVDMLAGLIADEMAESVSLTNGVVIEIHTSSIGSPRGRTFAAVLADEIAFWRSDDSVNPDAEVIGAVRPGMASIPGSMLLMASSPYARRGVLWTTFKSHFGRDDARVLVWRGTTLEMNPALDPAVIEDARAADPIAASAEFDAEFRQDISQFVAREVVEGCVVDERYEVAPQPGIRYSAFVDPSGGSADSMTLAITHRDGDSAVLDAVREAHPPFSPEGVVAEFAAVLRSYRVSRVVGDRYAGEWARERFRLHGMDYALSDRPKSDLYRDVLPVLNSGRAELLDLPRLVSQFCGLERRTARGGRDSIDHGPGQHDDLANSVAGALLLATDRGNGARVLRLPY